VPELTDKAGIKVLEDRCVSEVAALKAEACHPGRKRKLVVVLDDMSNSICRVADMVCV